MLTRILLIVAGLALGGCSTLTELSSMRKEYLHNEQGNVIGYKEMLRNEQTGEVVAQVELFTPLRDSSGNLIGYEEKAKGGSIVRDFEGRAIGGRFTDLRSRGTNARSRGLLVVFVPRTPDKVAKIEPGKPVFPQLVALLSDRDLRRIR